MGVYIKGMEMPKNEELIIICSDGTVEMTNNDGSWVCEQKAVEVPPHGRLIDVDALKHWILTEMACLDTEEDREFVADRLASELPTIIAEEDE